MDFRKITADSKNQQDPQTIPISGSNWWEPVEGSIPFDFCRESSLHGLKFIGQRKRHFTERIFWFLAFMTSVTVAVICIVQIWDKYRKTPVITVFQPTETTIDLIPFPAITICNSNNVLKSKADEFIQLGCNQFFRRANANSEDVTAFSELYMLDHVCQASTTFAERFNFSRYQVGINSSVREKLLDFQKNNPTLHSTDRPFTELLDDVSQKCNEMILLCMWLDEIRNCSDLFDEVETDFGYCCTFNMMPTSLLLSLRNDTRNTKQKVKDWDDLDLDSDKLILSDTDFEYRKRFPRYQFRPGKSSGLSVLLDPDLNSYFCTNTDSAGFIVSAHLPLDFPRVADTGNAIKPNSEFFLQIRPEVITADEDIRGFPLEKRKCYFGKEHSLKYYSYYTVSNCEDECIANLTFTQCNCVRYYMPRDENQTLCGPYQFNCTEIVRKKLMKEGLKNKCKSCLPTCTEIEYHTSTSYMPLRQDVSLWAFPNGTEAHWTHKNVSILHVYYSVDSTYAKLRKELYGFIDLLSSTGGLLGLCLGFSGLSLLEILYFLTLRAFCRSKKGKQVGDRFSQAAKSVWIQIYGSTRKWPFAEKPILPSSNVYSHVHMISSNYTKNDSINKQDQFNKLPHRIESGNVFW